MRSSVMEAEIVWLIHEQVAIAELDSGATAEAAILIRAVAKRFPSSLRTKRLQGMYWEAVGEFEQAERLYFETLQENPSCEMMAKRLIALEKSKGNLPGVIEGLKKYLEVFANDKEAWEELSEVYIESSMYRQALFCVEELILYQPNNTHYLTRYGDLLYTVANSSSNYRLARTSFAKATRYGDLLYTVASSSSNYRLARTYFAKAVELTQGQSPRALFGVLACCANITDKGDLSVEADPLQVSKLMLYRRSTVPDTPSVCHQSARPALRPSRAYARVHGRVSVSARPWHRAYALGADIANAESSCQPASQRTELASLRSTLAKQVEGFDDPWVETSQPVVVLAAAAVLSLVTKIPDWQQDLSNMDANNAVVSFLEEKERQAPPLSLLPFLTLLAAKAVLNSSRPREHKLRSTLRLRYRLVNWAYLHHASTYTAGEFKVNLVPALWAAAGELDPWFKTPKAASMITSPELRSQLWPADSAAQILHAYMPVIISLLNAQAVSKFRDRVQVIPASQAATKREHKRNTARCRVVQRDPAVRKVAGRKAAHHSTSTKVRFVLPRLCSLSKVVWRGRWEAAPQSKTSNRMVSIVQLVDALNTAIESSVGEAEGVDVAEEVVRWNEIAWTHMQSQGIDRI
eukprot:gene5710-12772_t